MKRNDEGLENYTPPTQVELPQFLKDKLALEKQSTEAEQPIEEEVVAEKSPTLEANGDDLAHLFEPPSREDPDIKVDDLVEVSEEDIFGEGGEDMSDLVDVSAEDIMGEDLGEPTQPPEPTQPKRLKIRRTRKPFHRPESPQSSIRGLR